MSANTGGNAKLGAGSVLAVLGGLGIAFGSGWGSSLPTPWSFISGFVTGILAGSGVALAVFGLIERRQGR